MASRAEVRYNHWAIPQQSVGGARYDSQMALTDGSTFAGFTILRMLGSGGMGEVYLARHPRLSRNDALKILPQELASDPDYRRRFDREADAAAALFHPHIVGIHDRGEYEGRLWISMDYVAGHDALHLLRERCASGLSRGEVIAIVTAVADALDYAHSRGLLHRDVKPANVLLTDAGPALRRIMLADFGIARRIDDTSGLTATNMTVGTLNYAAPEQLLGEPLDGRADQYALAATAFHLLTNMAPYAHSNPAVVISRRLSEPPPRLSDTHPELADMDPVIARGLATNPADRFGSCGEFASALRGGPLRVPPPQSMTIAAPSVTPFPPPTPLPPPTPRSGSRPPVWVLAGFGLLAAVAVVLGGTLLTRSQQQSRTATPLESSAIESAGAPSTPRSSVAASAPEIAGRPLIPQRSTLILPDADASGFINYNGGARCAQPDPAVMILRTRQSAVVICRGAAGGLYYRGYRISDGATIELGDVLSTATGYRAVNGAEGAFYDVSSRGLVIAQNGEVLSDEPAVESAS